MGLRLILSDISHESSEDEKSLFATSPFSFIFCSSNVQGRCLNHYKTFNVAQVADLLIDHLVFYNGGKINLPLSAAKGPWDLLFI